MIDTAEDRASGADEGNAPYGRCKHCDRPLPRPAARGRRRDYCAPEPQEGRDCREEAKRARQIAADAVIAAPQREISALFDRQVPQLQALQGFLGEVLERVADLRAGVLVRIGEVEDDAGEARSDAAEARAAARDAEEERDQALAATREQVAEARHLAQEARVARDQAVRDRDLAQQEAARQVSEAAARVREAVDRGAEQQRLRGQAEGERDSALRAHQDLAARLAAAELQWAQDRQALGEQLEELRSRIGARDEELAHTRSDLTSARERLEHAERMATQYVDRMQAAERKAEDARAEAQQARLDSATAQGDAATVRLLLVRTEADLTSARADASAQRERAATAEHRYADLQQATSAPPEPPADQPAKE